MRYISWNVNGLRAVVKKGFEEIFMALDADFFCIQETKLQEGQISLDLPGYESYWSYAEKKGYSGTAVFTKHTPLSVKYNIPGHEDEGRALTLEYEDFFLVCIYTPNSQDGLRRIDYRTSRPWGRTDSQSQWWWPDSTDRPAGRPARSSWKGPV